MVEPLDLPTTAFHQTVVFQCSSLQNRGRGGYLGGSVGLTQSGGSVSSLWGGAGGLMDSIEGTG